MEVSVEVEFIFIHALVIISTFNSWIFKEGVVQEGRLPVQPKNILIYICLSLDKTEKVK